MLSHNNHHLSTDTNERSAEYEMKKKEREKHELVDTGVNIPTTEPFLSN